MIKGNGAARGIAIAKVYKLEAQDLSFKKEKNPHIADELERLDNALALASTEIEQIQETTRTVIGDTQAEIFSSHLLILHDPEFIHSIKEKIKKENTIAEIALQEATTGFIALFKEMDNEYIRERVVDLTDISKRVLTHLLKVPLLDLTKLDEKVIVIGDDLTPSETAQFNSKYVKGLATNLGSNTSHTAIIARSLEIPAVVGLENITDLVQTEDIMIIDGDEGIVIINPDAEALASYKVKEANFTKQKYDHNLLKGEKTYTADGKQVKLAANISSPNEVNLALENGAEAIGLYRTEFLYMEKSKLPTEDEQYLAFKSVLQQMNDKPVIVRTLDAGGDKAIPYLHTRKERNPFLGFRAIRFCLANEEIFRPHLRALLRASIHGNLKIMFPMVATLEEFRAAKAMLLEEKENLLNKGIRVSDDIDLGIMIEIPSTALIASQLAKEVDFFSIGTNDLIQYTLAADRMNLWVSHLYQPCHPAVLQLIHIVIKAAHREGKWIGVCGEMASDPIAIPILLGLGLDEFSVNAASILPTKRQLRTLHKEELAHLKKHILNMGTAEEIEAFMKKKR